MSEISLSKAGLSAPPSGDRENLLAVLGPGLITGASDDDPSGIATYSQVGAQFGFAMCWVMLFTWPLMAAIQEISARIGRVTGDGIAGNIREHYPRWLLLVIVALLVVANVINLGADLGAMAAALQLILGGSTHLYVVGFAVLCALLEVVLRYENYVRVLKWTERARDHRHPDLGSGRRSAAPDRRRLHLCPVRARHHRDWVARRPGTRRIGG